MSTISTQGNARILNQSSRIIRSLNTMGKLSASQSHVYTLLDKLGPVSEIITKKGDEWEQ